MVSSNDSNIRKNRGRTLPDVQLPVAEGASQMPADYGAWLLHIKQLVAQERVRMVMSANAALVLLYWDIGRAILNKQDAQGWGTRVIDRLSHDLKQAFPQMSGFSPRNLKYMRSFARAWPERTIVQRTVAQLPWRSNLLLLEKLDSPEQRLWYAEKAIAQGLSKDVLSLQIESQWHARQGSASHNFAVALPPAESDMAAQAFKDPYLTKPMGVANWMQQLQQALPDEFKTSLPTVEEIESELQIDFGLGGWHDK